MITRDDFVVREEVLYTLGSSTSPERVHRFRTSVLLTEEISCPAHVLRAAKVDMIAQIREDLGDRMINRIYGDIANEIEDIRRQFMIASSHMDEHPCPALDAADSLQRLHQAIRGLSPFMNP